MNWYMLTVIGADQPGIVAQLSQALYLSGCYLGEASMLRLGEHFTIMLMIRTEQPATMLEAALEPVTERLSLHFHLDTIDRLPTSSTEPNVRITVSGADRPGIVAQVTEQLAGKHFNILDLSSGVAGSTEHPLYILHIEGEAPDGDLESIKEVLIPLIHSGIDVSVMPITTLIG